MSGLTERHGAGWEAVLANEEQVTTWVKGGGKDAWPLSIAKIEELLARQVQPRARQSTKRLVTSSMWRCPQGGQLLFDYPVT